MLNYPPDNFRVVTEIVGKLSETTSYTSTHVFTGGKNPLQVVLKIFS